MLTSAMCGPLMEFEKGRVRTRRRRRMEGRLSCFFWKPWELIGVVMEV